MKSENIRLLGLFAAAIAACFPNITILSCCTCSLECLELTTTDCSKKSFRVTVFYWEGWLSGQKQQTVNLPT